jgi:hypothetical protein
MKMGNPRPPQDRPNRLPLADPQLHRLEAEILFVPRYHRTQVRWADVPAGQAQFHGNDHRLRR